MKKVVCELGQFSEVIVMDNPETWEEQEMCLGWLDTETGKFLKPCMSCEFCLFKPIGEGSDNYDYEN